MTEPNRLFDVRLISGSLRPGKAVASYVRVAEGADMPPLVIEDPLQPTSAPGVACPYLPIRSHTCAFLASRLRERRTTSRGRGARL